MSIQDFSASRAFTMTPSGADASPPNGVPYARRLYCSAGGSVQLVTTGGDTVTYTGVAGQYIHVSCNLVKNGSTATLVGEY